MMITPQRLSVLLVAVAVVGPPALGLSLALPARRSQLMGGRVRGDTHATVPDPAARDPRPRPGRLRPRRVGAGHDTAPLASQGDLPFQVLLKYLSDLDAGPSGNLPDHGVVLEPPRWTCVASFVAGLPQGQPFT